MSKLFEPFSHKGLHLKNRVVMAPLCQYAASDRDGMPTEWHYVHIVSRAVGGTGLIMMEMTHIEEKGRITDQCLGIWSDQHIPGFKKIIDECHKYGAKVAIQIGHAGRKSMDTPEPVSCSPIAYNENYKVPRELTTNEVKNMVVTFQEGVKRAIKAGVDTVELHGAHGYLIHQFSSPSSNKRQDQYGEDKFLFGEEVIHAVKSVMPENMPLLMRISAVEYSDQGYDIDYAVAMAERFHRAGVDIFDVSSGGEGPIGLRRRPGNYPGYQVPYAERIKKEIQTPVIAAGKLDSPYLAESVVGNGSADLIAIGRGIMRNPYWANEASLLLDHTPLTPEHYKRAYN